MLLKRDLIIFSLVILLNVYTILILPRIATTSQEVIVYGTLGFFGLMVSFIILIVLSYAIKKFGHWGDQPVFHKKVKS